MKNYIISLITFVMLSFVMSSCDNETALKLNGAWAAIDNDSEYFEILTFTKTGPAAGDFKQSITLKMEIDEEVHGYEITMLGSWEINEDDDLVLKLDKESISTSYFLDNEIKEIKESAKQAESVMRDNANTFNNSYSSETGVENFSISEDGNSLCLSKDLKYKKM